MKRPISEMLLEVYNLGKSSTPATKPVDMERIDQIMSEIVCQVVFEALDYTLSREEK